MAAVGRNPAGQRYCADWAGLRTGVLYDCILSVATVTGAITDSIVNIASMTTVTGAVHINSIITATPALPTHPLIAILLL